MTRAIIAIAVVGALAVIASSGVLLLAGIGSGLRQLREEWAPDDPDPFE